MTAKQPTICPCGGDCPDRSVCDANGRCRRWTGATPLEVLFPHAPPPATHFVGFRGEEYRSAVRIWGLPDLYHRVWDRRALADVAPGDMVIFARYDPEHPSPFSYDDSNQAGDPAAGER